MGRAARSKSTLKDSNSGPNSRTCKAELKLQTTSPSRQRRENFQRSSEVTSFCPAKTLRSRIRTLLLCEIFRRKASQNARFFFWIRTRRCSGSSPVNCHERALPITRRSRNLEDLQQGIALVKITREIEMRTKSSLIHGSELVEAKLSSGETHMESYPLSLSRTEKASRVPRKFLAFSI